MLPLKIKSALLRALAILFFGIAGLLLIARDTPSFSVHELMVGQLYEVGLTGALLTVVSWLVACVIATFGALIWCAASKVANTAHSDTT